MSAIKQAQQKLIAAGASPQRAAQFVQQFVAANPTAKPKDILDWSDEKAAGMSEANWPDAWRPQQGIKDQTEAADYIRNIFGKTKIDQLKDQAWSDSLDWNRVFDSLPEGAKPVGLDQWIVDKITKKTPIGEIKTILASGSEEVIPLLGNLTPTEYGSLVEKYSSQYNKGVEAEGKMFNNFLSSDKYYKANIAHPKLKYGDKQDLAAGTIDFRTHPSVARRVAAQAAKVTRRKQIAQSPAAGYIGAAGVGAIGPQGMTPEQELQTRINRDAFQSARNENFAYAESAENLNFDKNLLAELNKSGASPFIDETKRRSFVKKKNFG